MGSSQALNAKHWILSKDDRDRLRHILQVYPTDGMLSRELSLSKRLSVSTYMLRKALRGGNLKQEAYQCITSPLSSLYEQYQYTYPKFCVKSWRGPLPLVGYFAAMKDPQNREAWVMAYALQLKILNKQYSDAQVLLQLFAEFFQAVSIPQGGGPSSGETSFHGASAARRLPKARPRPLEIPVRAEVSSEHRRTPRPLEKWVSFKSLNRGDRFEHEEKVFEKATIGWAYNEEGQYFQRFKSTELVVRVRQ